MVCDKVVCDRREEEGRRRAGGGHPGYRIKSKNPTQSCGEKDKTPFPTSEIQRLSMISCSHFPPIGKVPLRRPKKAKPAKLSRPSGLASSILSTALLPLRLLQKKSH